MRGQPGLRSQTLSQVPVQPMGQSQQTPAAPPPAKGMLPPWFQAPGAGAATFKVRRQGPSRGSRGTDRPPRGLGRHPTAHLALWPARQMLGSTQRASAGQGQLCCAISPCCNTPALGLWGCQDNPHTCDHVSTSARAWFRRTWTRSPFLASSERPHNMLTARLTPTTTSTLGVRCPETTTQEAHSAAPGNGGQQSRRGLPTTVPAWRFSSHALVSTAASPGTMEGQAGRCRRPICPRQQAGMWSENRNHLATAGLV